MPAVIRQAQGADAQQVASLWNDGIDQTTVTFTTERKTADAVQALIADRGSRFLVAEHGGAFLGFATCGPFRGGPGYRFTQEHSIWLRPQARGQGTGRALLRALEETARAQQIHSLIAAISGENPDAVAFHTRLGYREIARLPQVGFKFGRWLDLVLMQKKL